ncbi:MAG TPA: Hsp20/alpha crystallin family protein [Methanomicrobiales archaeon]|nr:Hsp20/alpha crystallin family protein [Methanomicrobiales archaeon]
MARRESPTDYRRDFDRVMSDLQRRLSEARAGRQVAMPEIQVDVREQDKDVVVTADLPGYDVEEITLRLTDPTTLQISARGEEASIEEKEDYYIQERSFGAVSRIVELPSSVTTDDAFATCNNGVLEVHLPKTPEARGREIPVGGGEQQAGTTRKKEGKTRPTKPTGEEQFKREQEQYRREQQEAEAAMKKTTSKKSVESTEEIRADLEQGLSPESKRVAEERRKRTEAEYRQDRKKFE